MDPAKYKKISDYASLLIQQAETEEKDKEYAFAIEKYLKAVDVLLVMADASPNYPAWVRCTGKAESIQKKIKSLIALAALKEEKERANPQTSQIIAGSQAATPSPSTQSVRT